MKPERQRSRAELVGIGAFAGLTVALAAALIVGVPAIFAVRALDEGATVAGVLWGLLAAGWIGLVLQAVVRSAETRGWVALLLVGWVGYLPAILRRLVRAARR